MGVSLLAILLASVLEWQVGSQSPSLAEGIQRSFHPQNVQGLKISWGKKKMFPYGGGWKKRSNSVNQSAPLCPLFRYRLEELGKNRKEGEIPDGKVLHGIPRQQEPKRWVPAWRRAAPCCTWLWAPPCAAPSKPPVL